LTCRFISPTLYTPSSTKERKIIQDLLDQEFLSVNVKSWRDGNPDACIYFRQSAVVQRPTLEDEADENILTTAEEQPFLFVYQNSWQKHMLQRYGEASGLPSLHDFTLTDKNS
jgi:hypothetical protein